MATSLKLTTVGDSLGIPLPEEFLLRFKLNKGDTVTLIETPYGFKLVAGDKELASQLEAVEKVMFENREVLRRLAKS